MRCIAHLERITEVELVKKVSKLLLRKEDGCSGYSKIKEYSDKSHGPSRTVEFLNTMQTVNLWVEMLPFDLINCIFCWRSLFFYSVFSYAPILDPLKHDGFLGLFGNQEQWQHYSVLQLLTVWAM